MDRQPLTGAGARFIVLLSDLTRAHMDRAGAKAANLGEMLRAGFPVPDGFVLTADAFECFLSANALGVASPQEAVATASLPPELEDVLRAAAAPFGEIPLAVRSSGVAEDLPDASFAGQYETVLGVRGFDALVRAVCQCWASAFSHRVSAYKAAKGQASSGGMAVLVQHLVQADAAGVAFTANPVTGDRSESVVSAVRGLGERLVSGQATPDEWVVRGQDAVCRGAPEGAITAAQAGAVAELARRAEAHFGAPQDVEWAIADGKLFMLQARPITALPEPAVEPIPVSVDPPPGFWERDTAHCPEPLCPMFRSAILPVHERAFYEMFHELSVPMEGVQLREIGGWLYTRTVPPGGKDVPPPPAWLMPLLIRLVPAMRRLVKGMVETVRADKPWKIVERWYAEWRPNTIARINELRKIELTPLSDRELEHYLEQVLTFASDCLQIHARVSAGDIFVAELALTCQELLGWDGRKSLGLLSGLSGRTTEPTYRLGELARVAQDRPAVRQLLDHIGDDTPRRLAAVDGEFAAAFERYLQEFGCRTLRWELIEATVAEKPELVLRLIRDQIARGYNPEADAAALEQKRAAVLAEARQLLASRSPTETEQFERALARAERAYPVREDHEFYITNAPLALLRYALLEVGKRMTERAQLDRAEDVLFLELEEARTAFRDRADRSATVIRRKGELAWAKAHPGPAFYGKPPGPPPSFAAFPPEARRMMQGFLWLMESLGATQYIQQAKTAAGKSLQGLAASPGQYTGPARIIMNESEFGKLQAGDVLVCPTTQPPWSVLFPSVGALVTDSGGILSHPAIIAREYHVPAVVAIGNATSVLRDGQVVSVDGNAGHVEVSG